MMRAKALPITTITTNTIARVYKVFSLAFIDGGSSVVMSGMMLVFPAPIHE